MIGGYVYQGIAAAGLIGAATALVVGLIQYQNAQKWKKAEWVAGETRRFLDARLIGQALTMIDWGTRRLLLLPEHPVPEKRHVIVTDDMVSTALMHHKDHKEQFGDFTDAEAAIRDAFDAFLDGLDRFETFIEAGLVKMGDVAGLGLRRPSVW